jgi:ATP-dependent protease HslVU (ClpYQ) peptidase subunit
MTTIVAYQGQDYAIVGVDSRVSSIDADGFASQIMTLAPGSTKVASNGKYLLGVAGDVRAINILHHVFQPPSLTPGLKGKKLDQFMTLKFIPALRDCFEKQGYAAPERDTSSHIAEQGSTILVVVNATIYVVDYDYAWASDATGIYALGTGSQYALGAMSVLINKDKKVVSPTQAKNYIVKSLNIAAKFDPYTGSPFQTFVQDYSE